jgi:cytochrome P450
VKPDAPTSESETPAAAVTDFNSHDPAIAADPFPTYERLRATCPVTWSRSWGGFWVVSGHAEVASASRSPLVKTAQTLADGTTQGVSIPPLGHTGKLVPLEMDSPACLKYRRLLASFYSPSRVKARMPEFRRLAAECLNEVIESGSCDIVTALTLRLPGILTMRDIGLPEERWAEIETMLHRALLSAPHDLAASREAAQLICLDIIEEMEARRDGANGGLIEYLLKARVDGQPVSDEDIISMMYLLLLGIDPTSTLTATTLLYLAGDPELKARLIADRTLIPDVADEFLRWVSPVQGTSRTLAADMVSGGQELRPGDRLLLIWASANRDESVFPDAGRVDPDRDASAHLAFGGGQHYCLGAAMVRAMFTAMLDEVLTRIPDYVPSADAKWFPDLSSVYGVNELRITFPATPRNS